MSNPNSISARAGILIGGGSQRFGSPKWNAKIGKTSVLDRLWDVCSDFEKRVVIGKSKPNQIKKPFLSDLTASQAPIFGLYTLLYNSEYKWNLLLSCDLPLLTKNLLKKIWDARDNQADIILPNLNGINQVTCALYKKNLIGEVEKAIKNESLSLQKLVNESRVRKITVESWNQELTNMNTLEDWKRIKYREENKTSN